jgi:phospholipase A-2-activating protein
MASLEGHQSFVYGITHACDGKTLLSSSDDSTAKVWSLADMSCQQSVIHAGTVWQSVSLPNGDFATACADQIVRVWTTNPDRMAPQEERQTQKDIAHDAGLQASAKGSSSSPMDSALDISQMPTTVGKKNGEIKCFKEGPVVNAYSWNEGTRSWDKIGEVVGSKEEKKFYAGDHVFARGEYDFVWDVDMGPAHGMKKLPFNKGQNPMAVAEAFIAREQIDKGNMDQIRQFIMQNAGPDGCGTAPLGASTQEPKPKAPEPAQTMFPIQTHVNFKDGKFEPLLKKLLEFNTQVPEELQLPPTDVGFLQEAVEKLKSGGVKTELRACEKEVIHVKLAAWPGDKLFPVMDLWRLFVCHPQSCDYFKGSDRGSPFIMKVTELLATDVNGPLGLCCARYLANLFMYQTNRHACFDKRDAVLRTIQPALSSSNKHTKVAATTILLNHAIVLHEISFPPKPWDQECGVRVAGMTLDFLDGAAAEDGDAKQRALFALGTLLVRDKENGGVVQEMCKARGLPSKLAGLEKDAGRPVVAELKKLVS